MRTYRRTDGASSYFKRCTTWASEPPWKESPTGQQREHHRTEAVQIGAEWLPAPSDCSGDMKSAVPTTLPSGRLVRRPEQLGDAKIRQLHSSARATGDQPA